MGCVLDLTLEILGGKVKGWADMPFKAAFELGIGPGKEAAAGWPSLDLRMRGGSEFRREAVIVDEVSA